MIFFLGLRIPKLPKIAGLWKNDHQLGDRSPYLLYFKGDFIRIQPKTEGLAADGKSAELRCDDRTTEISRRIQWGIYLSVYLSISLYIYLYLHLYIYIYSLSSIFHQQNIVNIGDADSKSFFDLHEPNGATWRLAKCGFLKGSFPVDLLWHKKQSDRQNINIYNLPAIFFELESRFPNELLFLSRFIN